MPRMRASAWRRPVVASLLGGLIWLTVGMSAFAQDGAVKEQAGCVVERVVHTHEGLRLIGWVMRPKGEGPWPAIVVNHGSRFAADGRDASQEPTLSLDEPCLSDVASGHRLYFFPEGRGYGGSEGPRLRDAIMSGGGWPASLPAVEGYLRDRARDANAGVDWLIARGVIRADAVVVTGASHGGVVTLFAAAERDSYRGVAIQATGLCYYHADCGAASLDESVARIKAPLLIEHALSDTLVPAAVSRRLAAVARRGNPDITLIEYPGTLGAEGHAFFSAANRDIWGPPRFGFVARVLAPVDRRHAADPPALPAAVSHAADYLPADLAIVPPPADLAPDRGRFSGRWRGFWDGALEHIFIVERVAADGADVVYAWGRAQRSPPGWLRVKARWEEGSLRVSLSRPAEVSYRLLPDGRMAARYQWQGGVSHATLTRQD